MAKLKMEGNKIVVDSELCENNIHVFEIVEKIPAGFFIWNIGENMGTHEYIPLCEDLHPENKDDYSINPETLKAVKVSPDEWEKLNKAASVGVGNLKAAEKALKTSAADIGATGREPPQNLQFPFSAEFANKSKPPPGGL